MSTTLRLQDPSVLAILRDHGSLYLTKDGHHFVGTSGQHLSGYCNIDPVLPHTNLLSQLTRLLVRAFVDDPIEAVVAPAVGGIPFSQWGPYHWQELSGQTVPGVWADKVDGKLTIVRAGFEKAIAGKRVLILEDVINRMHTVRQAVQAVTETGGKVVGIGAVAATEIASAEGCGVPKLVALCDITYEAWLPADCSLCQSRVPIVADVGHGEDFRRQQPDYPGGFVNLR